MTKRKNRKYTKEMLEGVVSTSLSFAEVLRKLKLAPAGGSQSHIRKRVAEYGISTAHFTGAVWNKGGIGRRGGAKRDAASVLVFSDGLNRVRAVYLRRAMIESGVPFECFRCKQGGEWMGRSLMLEVHHINGVILDNRRENLQFLCPNCHSQE